MREFIVLLTFLCRAAAGCLLDVRAHHGKRWGYVAVLSGIAYLLLSSSSALEELARRNADVASGQQVFNNVCRTCHSTKEGDNRLGPHLRGIIGRKAGSLPNYAYSSAMKGANFVWDEEKLERFIANPDEMVPGKSKTGRFLETTHGRTTTSFVSTGQIYCGTIPSRILHHLAPDVGVEAVDQS